MTINTMASRPNPGQTPPAAQMLTGFSKFAGAPGWTPAVNLYESAEAYVVCVDLAGVDKDKIAVDVGSGVLSLRGNRLPPNKACPPEGLGLAQCRIHVMEIDDGPFSRQVELPSDVNEQAICARYRDGLLWIELPRTHK